MRKFVNEKENLTAYEMGNTLYAVKKDDVILKYDTPSNILENEKWVEEECFEILKFQNPINNKIYKKKNYHYSYDDDIIGERSLEYCLEFYNIVSVKRLNDGLIVNLGDIINSNDDLNKNVKVQDIKHDKGKIQIYGDFFSEYLSFYYLENIKKGSI